MYSYMYTLERTRAYPCTQRMKQTVAKRSTLVLRMFFRTVLSLEVTGNSVFKRQSSSGAKTCAWCHSASERAFECHSGSESTGSNVFERYGGS